MASADDGEEVIFEKVKAILSSSWANKNDERRRDLFIQVKKKFRNVEIRYTKGSYVFVGTFDEIAQIEKLVRKYSSSHSYGRNPEIQVNKTSENSFFEGRNTNKDHDQSGFESDRKGIPHQNATNGASGGGAEVHGTRARDGSDGKKDGEDRSDEGNSSSKSKEEPTRKEENSNRKESKDHCDEEVDEKKFVQRTVPTFIWKYIEKYKIEEFENLKKICPLFFCTEIMKVDSDDVTLIDIPPSTTSDQVSKFDDYFVKLCSRITKTDDLEIDIGGMTDEELEKTLKKHHPEVELMIKSSNERSGQKIILIGENSDIQKAKEFCKRLGEIDITSGDSSQF